MSSIGFALAWRNIWRNKRRTVLTASAVALAAAILVFFIGLQLSSYGAAINATTALFQGHLQVQVEGYLDRPQMHLDIENVDELTEELNQLPGVLGSAPRGVGFALISSEERTLGVQVMGVDPNLEPNVSTIPGLIREGRFLTESDSMQAVLGEALARNLKVDLGDELTLMGQGKGGSLAVGVLQVAGIFRSGSRDLDRSLLEIPLRSFQEMFYMPAAGHHVAVKIPDVQQADKEQAIMLKQLAGRSSRGKRLTVHTWEELVPGLRQAIELDMASGWLFYMSLVVIVVFSVLNTFLMSILERTREFGVLLALGLRPGKIIGMVLIELLLLLATGLLPGILVGGGFIFYYGIYGFFIPGTEEIMKIWNLPGAIYPRLSFAAVSVGPGIIVVCSILLVIIPALRIRKLEPVTAMRAA